MPSDVARFAPSGTPVAAMPTGRDGHTARLLLDGRVLVVGGTNGGFDLRSAELYDPAIRP